MPIAYPQAARRPAIHLCTPSPDPGDDRLQLLRSILADQHWSCPPAVRGQLLQVLACAAGTGCTSEQAWMALAEEIARYLLYRRTGQHDIEPLEWPRTRRGHVAHIGRRLGA